MEWAITELTVVAVAAILISASIHDWREREIPDWHWVALFVMATCLSVSDVLVNGLGPIGFLMPFTIAIIAFDCIYDRESTVVFDLCIYAMIAVMSITVLTQVENDIAKNFVSIPVTYAVMSILYYTGIVKGGADAKSIICIASVFPTYPQMLGLPIIDVPDGPISQFMTPAFAVLTMALVISLGYGVYNIVRNLIEGNIRVPQMFLGTIMPLEVARNSKVWPMEEVVGNNVELLASANEDEDIWDKLESAGEKNVWVTAIIPFLIPITIAYILMISIGFPLFI